MPTQDILYTKLYIPPTRPDMVPRLRLIERLNNGLHRKLTLISAPAGFGKSTLLSEWVQALRSDPEASKNPKLEVAWLSLDEGENDPTRFLAYVIAALKQINRLGADFGKSSMTMLQSPQPPPIETILTSLINELAAVSHKIILVLDDYQRLDSPSVDNSIDFLLENLPQQLHIVLSSWDDPQVPFARLRALDQVTELRASDLRFTSSGGRTYGLPDLPLWKAGWEATLPTLRYGVIGVLALPFISALSSWFPCRTILRGNPVETIFARTGRTRKLRSQSSRHALSAGLLLAEADQGCAQA